MPASPSRRCGTFTMDTEDDVCVSVHIQNLKCVNVCIHVQESVE